MTSARIIRAKTATAEMPVAMAVFVVSKPSAVTMTTASRKLGIASSIYDQAGQYDIDPAAEEAGQETDDAPRDEANGRRR